MAPTATGSSFLKRALLLFVKGTVALVTGAVIMVLAGATLPSFFGFHPMVVTSGSMRPGIDVGDVVVLKEIPENQISEGDIVTFLQQDGEGMTTHRVVDLKQMENGTWIQTKGDANESPDPDLTHVDAVYGQVRMTIPKVGPALLFAATPVGKLILLGVPALLMGLMEIGNFRSALRARRAQPAGQATSAEADAPAPTSAPKVLGPAFAFSPEGRRARRSRRSRRSTSKQERSDDRPVAASQLVS